MFSNILEETPVISLKLPGQCQKDCCCDRHCSCENEAAGERVHVSELDYRNPRVEEPDYLQMALDPDVKLTVTLVHPTKGMFNLALSPAMLTFNDSRLEDMYRVSRCLTIRGTTLTHLSIGSICLMYVLVRGLVAGAWDYFYPLALAVVAFYLTFLSWFLCERFPPPPSTLPAGGETVKRQQYSEPRKPDYENGSLTEYPASLDVPGKRPPKMSTGKDAARSAYLTASVVASRAEWLAIAALICPSCFFIMRPLLEQYCVEDRHGSSFHCVHRIWDYAPTFVMFPILGLLNIRGFISCILIVGINVLAGIMRLALDSLYTRPLSPVVPWMQWQSVAMWSACACLAAVAKERFHRRIFICRLLLLEKERTVESHRRHFDQTLQMLLPGSALVKLAKGVPVQDYAEQCTVSVCQVKDFHRWSTTLLPDQAMEIVDILYQSFDSFLKPPSDQHQSTLRKTIMTGDCYIVAAGLRDLGKNLAKDSGMSPNTLFTLECCIFAKTQLSLVTRMFTDGLSIGIGIARGVSYGSILGQHYLRYNMAGPAFEEANHLSCCAGNNEAFANYAAVTGALSVLFVEAVPECGSVTTEEGETQNAAYRIVNFGRPRKARQGAEAAAASDGGSLQDGDQEVDEDDAEAAYAGATEQEIDVLKAQLVRVARGIQFAVPETEREYWNTCCIVRESQIDLLTSLMLALVMIVVPIFEENAGAWHVVFVCLGLAVGILRYVLQGLVCTQRRYIPYWLFIFQILFTLLSTLFLAHPKGILHYSHIAISLMLSFIMMLAQGTVPWQWAGITYLVQFTTMIIVMVFVQYDGEADIRMLLAFPSLLVGGLFMFGVHTQEKEQRDFFATRKLSVAAAHLLEEKMERYKRLLEKIIPPCVVDAVGSKINSGGDCVVQKIPDCTVLAIRLKAGLTGQGYAGSSVMDQSTTSYQSTNSKSSSSQSTTSSRKSTTGPWTSLSTSSSFTQPTTTTTTTTTPQEAALVRSKDHMGQALRDQYRAVEQVLQQLKAAHSYCSLVHAVGDTVLVGGPLINLQQSSNALDPSVVEMTELKGLHTRDSVEVAAGECAKLLLRCMRLLRLRYGTNLTASLASGSGYAAVLGEFLPSFDLLGSACRTAVEMLETAPDGFLGCTEAFIKLLQCTAAPGEDRVVSAGFQAPGASSGWRLRGAGQVRVVLLAVNSKCSPGVGAQHLPDELIPQGMNLFPGEPLKRQETPSSGSEIL